MKTGLTVQDKAGKIDKNRLKVALKILHGRWGETTPKENLSWKVLASEANCVGAHGFPNTSGNAEGCRNPWVKFHGRFGR